MYHVILDQIYIIYLRIFIMVINDFIFFKYYIILNIIQKHINIRVELNLILWNPCCFHSSDISSNSLKIFIFKYKIYAFYLFGKKNAFFIPNCHVKAVQDVISLKTILI